MAAGVTGTGPRADIQVTLARRGQLPRTVLTEEDQEALRAQPRARMRDYGEGRGLLRWSLREVFGAQWAGAPVRPDRGGRPVLLTERRIGISISHSENAVAVAVAAGRDVGVDVQSPVVPTGGLISRCCRPQDHEEMAGLSDPLLTGAFTSMWTVQESCLKASGEGVRFRPGRVPVVPFQCAGSWRDYAWRALPSFAGDFVAVAASRLPVPPATVRIVLARPSDERKP
ncbi:4'-phosphopantetheinyl transferase family protein [Streptomyces sp. NPDC057575]|uniref:4'-phosphopantetheinyl transferase family protein n=1 Tax=unclassified Streptomyces TaxID=2593676 RepID=UPI0036BBE037